MKARPLLVTWALLMALTALAGVAADVTGRGTPGALALAALAAIIIAKTRLILSRYLRLSQAPAALAGFTAAVAAVMIIVTLVFVSGLELRPAVHRAATFSGAGLMHIGGGCGTLPIVGAG